MSPVKVVSVGVAWLTVGGPGAGHVSGVPTLVGLYVPLGIGVTAAGTVAAAASSKIKVVLDRSLAPAASDNRITFRPVGLCNTMSISLVQVWFILASVTFLTATPVVGNPDTTRFAG